MGVRGTESDTAYRNSAFSKHNARHHTHRQVCIVVRAFATKLRSSRHRIRCHVYAATRRRRMPPRRAGVTAHVLRAQTGGPPRALTELNFGPHKLGVDAVLALLALVHELEGVEDVHDQTRLHTEQRPQHARLALSRRSAAPHAREVVRDIDDHELGVGRKEAKRMSDGCAGVAKRE